MNERIVSTYSISFGYARYLPNRINTSSEEGMQADETGRKEITMKAYIEIQIDCITNIDTYGSVTNSYNRNA